MAHRSAKQTCPLNPMMVSSQDQPSAGANGFFDDPSPVGASGSQHTVASQRAALDRPSIASRSARVAAHESQQAELAGSVRAKNARRHEAVSIVAGALADFIHTLGVGAKFQSVDFTSRMYELRLWPDNQVFDRRSTGAMYNRLKRAGVLRVVGYQPDGGCKHTRHNSAVRPVFEILRTTSHREVLGL